MNFKVLAYMYSSSEANPVTTDILHFISGTKTQQSMPSKFLTFLMKELANTKILGRLDESC